MSTSQRNLLRAPQTSDVSVQAKIVEVERELRFRERVYPRLISQDKLTKRQADEQMLIMRAILEDYYRLARGEPCQR